MVLPLDIFVLVARFLPRDPEHTENTVTVLGACQAVRDLALFPVWRQAYEVLRVNAGRLGGRLAATRGAVARGATMAGPDRAPRSATCSGRRTFKPERFLCFNQYGKFLEKLRGLRLVF